MHYRLRALLILCPLLHSLFCGCEGTSPATGFKTKATALINPTGHQSPEQAFKAYIEACEAGDWVKAFNSMTPAMQDVQVAGLYFAAGMYDSKVTVRHLDESAFQAAVGEEPTEEKVIAALLKHTKDKRAFFVDAATEMDIRNESPCGPLTDVTITGQRAHGVVFRVMERVEIKLRGYPRSMVTPQGCI